MTDRFWPKVDKRGPDECWEWTASRNSYGYGRFHTSRTTRVSAHRVAWESTNGPVPIGMVLDHLCRNRACCNPTHMEVVTPRENTLRGNTPAAVTVRTGICAKGHVLDPGNTYVSPSNGERQCRRCRADRARESYWRNPAKARASARDRYWRAHDEATR